MQLLPFLQIATLVIKLQLVCLSIVGLDMVAAMQNCGANSWKDLNFFYFSIINFLNAKFT